MKSRLLAATVLAASLLVVPVASHAQKADSVATRGALAGRGAIGAQIGSSYFFSGGDYAKGANPRLTFIGHFRYQTKNPRWGWQVSPMFTWNGYVSNQDAPFVDPNFPTTSRTSPASPRRCSGSVAVGRRVGMWAPGRRSIT
ncbi:MAG: hypothetical protein RL721_801 [Candidatus Eisenbacteria bacterium]